jgi:uncharacterized protein (TIGR01777 family)
MDRAHTIAISGASGLIGSRLTKYFKSKTRRVIPLSRNDFAGSTEALSQKLDQADVVINLTGAPVIKRWTEKHKKEIYSSRIITTRKLVEAIERMKNKPSLFVSASAVGIYDQAHMHDENSVHFAGDFLSDVCTTWEAETEKLSQSTRLAIIRLGIVLASEGGALKTMLPPFRLGIGGKIATGRQPFAWIHIDDVVNAIDFIIENDKAKGVYNLVAPGLINNSQFTATLGKALKRPTWFTVPAFALRLLYGEAAFTLTGGQKVVPMRLEEAGFKFSYPDIEPALRSLLTK